MREYNQIFLPYRPKAKVDYINLLYLYGIAERYEDREMKQDICFSSFRDLEEQINNKYSKSNEKKVVSQATLNRMVKKEDYEPFFTYHRCYYGK